MTDLRISRKNNAQHSALAASYLRSPMTFEILVWACEVLERDFFVAPEMAKRLINNRGIGFESMIRWSKRHIAHGSKMNLRNEQITRNLLQAIIALDMVYDLSSTVHTFDDTQQG